MKKITLLLILLFLGCGSYLFSQSLVYVRNGEILENGSTVVVTEVANPDVYPVMDAHILVRNQTSAAISFATMTISLVEETSSEGMIGFCGWGGNCLPVDYGYPLSRTITIPAGGEVNPDVEAMGVNPESVSFKVEYKLTYGDNTQTIYVLFTSVAAISSHKKVTSIIVLNNENGVSINYNFESTAGRQLSIHNIIGQKIAEVNLVNKSGNIRLPNITKGIYFYSLTENKQMLQSGKFIAK